MDRHLTATGNEDVTGPRDGIFMCGNTPIQIHADCQKFCQ